MADILIKSMEMPKSCFYCPFRERVNANPYDYVCMALNKEFEEIFSLIIGTRHKDCPLVPVPRADVEPVVQRKSVLTNADRIRAMSDEELAEWIARHDCRTNIYGYDKVETILDWLMKEAPRRE